MLNSSTSTSITTFDIDVFTDFSLLFSPFFVSNYFLLCGHRVPLQQSFQKKSSSVGTAFVLHYPWSVIHSSVETATATETLQQVELHPGTTASTEKSKNFFLNNSLFSHGTRYFLNLAAKNRFWRCPFYTALRNCSEPP